MLNKILCFILLGVFAGLAPAGAQTAPAAPVRVKGKIIAARVQGHVEAIVAGGAAPRVLHDGDNLTDQTQVVTSPGANVILVFSNGATVNVSEDSTLDIEKFEQDPFGADLNMGDLKKEPGTSTTKLNLAKGELVGKVVHLNVDQGSEFSVQTPVGAAGIRGTTFRIVFRPAKNGKAFFVVTTAEGVVVFKGITSNQVSIPAGKTVVATFDYTPPATGGSGGTGSSGSGTGSSGSGTGTGTGTGSTTSTPAVTILTTQDITPTEATQIDTAGAAIATSNQVVNFAGNTGSSAPSTTTITPTTPITSTTTSPATPPPPPTTGGGAGTP